MSWLREDWRTCLLLCLLAVVGLAAPGAFPEAHYITIDADETGEPISEYIYGQFIEHLGRCIYGGIWAEMLEDRKFFYPVVKTDESPWTLTRQKAEVLAASPWQVIGGADTVTMDASAPYVGEHTPVVHLRPDGPSGIAQTDLGVVAGKHYVGRIVLSGEGALRPVRVSLVWGRGEANRQMLTLRKVGKGFKTYDLAFTASASSDNATLRVVARGTGTLKIGTVSLMPADNVDGFRADTLALLKELDSPIYRWPGGNFVSAYDWRDGIGDRDKRPPRKNPAWTGIEHNDVGIHEFMALCRLLDTEPFIAVNTGLGTVQEVRDQVEYVNGAADTPMGKLRAQNGRPEPFGCTFWAVGNEMYGNWQKGHMPLEDYVKKHNAVVDAMRAVDDSLKLVAVGNVGPWSERMMQDCAEHMDLISEHFYVRERRMADGQPESVAAHVALVPMRVRQIAEAHRDYRSRFASLEDKDIRIALDEWNYWYGEHVFGELGTRYFLKDALGIAAGLHEYFRQSDIYYMANYAQTVNVIGCIKTTKTAADFETTGLVLMLYRKHFGEIPIAVGGDLETLDVAAAWTTDRSAITAAAVNPTDEPQELFVDLQGADPAGTVKVWRISGDDPMAYNDPGKIRRVDIEEFTQPVQPGLTLPPYSITLVKVDVFR